MRIRLAGIFLALAAGASQAAEVVVYSARNEQLIKPLFEAYTRETGVQVLYTTDKEGPLLARLQSEGESTPADMLITVDAGNLWQAAQLGLLAEVNSPALQRDVPAHLRDPGNRWFGLSVRARTIFHNPAAVKADQLSSYEDLADPKWKGLLCLRSAKKVYNQSLVAMLIAKHGEAEAERIVRGWVANLATAPFADDTKLLEAIASGQCSVGIANTYYYGRLMKQQPDLSLAIFWPNQAAGQGGVHVNIAGAGITRHAKHPEEARKLLEWLASAHAQGMFAGINMEYPVNPAVTPSPEVTQWGTFQQSTLNLNHAGEAQAQAVRLMDRAGYQ